MEYRRSQSSVQDRRSGSSTSSAGWLRQHSPLTFGSEFVRSGKQVGVELLSAAHSTMTWWEKHKNDMIIEDGQKIPRYELKPSFVSHAQEILRKAAM